MKETKSIKTFIQLILFLLNFFSVNDYRDRFQVNGARPTRDTFPQSPIDQRNLPSLSAQSSRF